MRTLLSAVVLVLLCAAPVAAEDNFTSHWDLFNVTSKDGEVKVMDFGYHFTVFRFANRVHVLGAGLGLDLWSKCPSWGCEYAGDREYFGSPFVIVPIADVALGDIGKNGFWSFGVKYTYNLRLQEHRITGGFSYSFP